MQASLRAATPEDASFLFQLQCATMKAYVVQTWGEWDETWQSRYFRERFDPASTQIVVVQGQDAGVLWVERCPTEFFLRSIAILPAFQRHGIGTWLIQSLIAEAHGQGLPVMLLVLKDETFMTAEPAPPMSWHDVQFSFPAAPLFHTASWNEVVDVPPP